MRDRDGVSWQIPPLPSFRPKLPIPGGGSRTVNRNQGLFGRPQEQTHLRLGAQQGKPSGRHLV